MSEVLSVRSATGEIYCVGQWAGHSFDRQEVKRIDVEYPTDPHAPTAPTAAFVGTSPQATVYLEDGRTIELFGVVAAERAPLKPHVRSV